MPQSNRQETWLNDCIFTVTQFLSHKECQNYIRLAEECGFEEALVTTATGAIRAAGLRNNDRVLFKNELMAEQLWERASDFVPMEFEGRNAIGLNELFRFYRYDPGQQFNWHQDFAYERDNGEASYLTLLVYLNDDFDGGETSFDDSYSEESFDEFDVKPIEGMALFFEHPTHHKGEPVTKGRKYVLRTDVMYSELEGEEEFDDDTYDDIDNW